MKSEFPEATCSNWAQGQAYTLHVLRLLISIWLATYSLGADAQPQSGSPPQWQIYAGCAGAYQADWQLRQAVRARDMSDAIKEQADEYKTKAAGFYEKALKAQPSEARRAVETYVSSNLDRFTAMEKAGTLEAYIN